MTRTRLRMLSWLPAGVFITNELIRTYVRPVYGRRQYGLLSTVLGWLPNLLAAFGFVALGLAVLLLLQRQLGYLLPRWGRGLTLLGVAGVGLAGLIGHEVTQHNSGLYYDPSDIWATVAGTACGAALYAWVLLRPEKNFRNK